MLSEFDPVVSETFVEVARQRRLLSGEQVQVLLRTSSERSAMASRVAIELGLLKPMDVEIVEAFMSPRDLAPGYELLDVLGYGALGVVYRARQPHLQRDVAIKAITQSQLTEQNAIARFQQEGAAIGRLQHPNIVSAYDSGSHKNRLYLVMELVDGVDLRRRLDDGPVEVSTALSLVRQTASGLAHALAQRIIHRDIKPGNLILTEAPAGFDLPPGVPLVKIADFGLARLNSLTESEHQDTRLTMTGAALGTPMYCAPEQLTGDDIDHRADIYALGATLFGMLTGQVPFEGSTVSKVIAAKVTGQPPRLDLLPGDLDADVRQLMLDMMSHDPHDRVPDYATLIGRIDRLDPYSRVVTGSSVRFASSATQLAVNPGTQLAAQSSTSTVEPAKASTISRRRAFVLGGGLLLTVVVTALAISKLATPPPTPSMMPSGWETYLFDGKTVTGWTGRSGLWRSGKDSEGGAVLVGKGSAVRRLTPAAASAGRHQLGTGGTSRDRSAASRRGGSAFRIFRTRRFGLKPERDSHFARWSRVGNAPRNRRQFRSTRRFHRAADPGRRRTAVP